MLKSANCQSEDLISVNPMADAQTVERPVDLKGSRFIMVFNLLHHCKDNLFPIEFAIMLFQYASHINLKKVVIFFEFGTFYHRENLI